MFMGDTTDDSVLCPFKDSYLWEVPLTELVPGATVLALDLAITGKRDGHGYAVVSSGQYACKGKAIVLEAGELVGAVDDLIPQIVELVKRHRVHSVVVEKAGGGHFLLKALNQSMADFGVNVEAVTAVKSKWQRLEAELGGMALGQVLVPTAAPWLLKLRQQFRTIATRQTAQRDDIADATMHGLQMVGRWIRGGFQLSSAEWGRGTLFHQQHNNTATWTHGTKAHASEGSEFSWPADREMPKPIWD